MLVPQAEEEAQAAAELLSKAEKATMALKQQVGVLLFRCVDSTISGMRQLLDICICV